MNKSLFLALSLFVFVGSFSLLVVEANACGCSAATSIDLTPEISERYIAP